MSIILKDPYGIDKTYDHDKIFVRNEKGELVQFTQGAGGAVLEPLEVTENGVYNPPAGVDGFGSVAVRVSGAGGLLDESLIATGEFKVVSEDEVVVIPHNLGRIPDYVKLQANSVSQGKVCYAIGFRSAIFVEQYQEIVLAATATGAPTVMGGTIPIDDARGSVTGVFHDANATSVKFGGLLCKFDTNVKYMWTAVRFME